MRLPKVLTNDKLTVYTASVCAPESDLHIAVEERHTKLVWTDAHSAF